MPIVRHGHLPISVFIRMKRIDRTRTEYHRYFTGRNWMDMENYDLPINASRIDYDQMIVLIKDYMRLRGFLE